MSAFRRRTTFAAPVILTVAACSSAKEKPNQDKPESLEQTKTETPGNTKTALVGPTWHVRMDNMKCFAQQSGNPPPPQQEIQCPPGMSGNVHMAVTQLAADKCAVVPPNCNDASCAKPSTPCPLPPGQKLIQKLAFVWTIEKRGAKCHAEEEDHDCPPGVDCNPPAPRTFPCPPGVTEAKPLHIAELPDTTCVIVPDGCLDTGCATETIPCPAMK